MTDFINNAIMSVMKRCEAFGCENLILSKRKDAKYCSKTCGNTERSRRFREFNPEKVKEYHQQYYLDNIETLKEKGRIHYLENKDEYIRRAKEWYENNKEHAIKRQIAYAKAHPEQTRAKQKKWEQANPEKKRISNRRRYARKMDARIEPYKDQDIFERDNWTCGLCGNPVDPELPFVDPETNVWNGLSKSIGHVIPLARGGADAPDNVRLEHLICNLEKAVRTDEELEWLI